ncbi:MAG TPA: aldose 1-epimerase family protein [Actinomycetales bacterium]|nr:aldose 1-epimerase family protein [Actinomycetales bacterium]
MTVNFSHVRNSSGALPDPPSGRQHEITSGGYRAVITEVGAALRRLSHDDRPLVVGFSIDEVMPSYRGAQLIPWPNRIADGQYKFGGREFQVPITEPERENALHGFVVWESWRTVLHVRDRVVLSHRVQPRNGYPWRLDVTVDFAIGPDGLRCTVEALNTGDSAAPYGYGPHPYLQAGESPLDEWSLEVPAEEYLEVTPDRLLPTGIAPVEGTELDFRDARPIGATEIDHAYTTVKRDNSGTATVRVRDPRGGGVEMSWPSTAPWVQVHTADLPDPENNRLGLAVEPMTCPPDAFNSGTDLVVIEPGDSHRTSWTIRSISE